MKRDSLQPMISDVGSYLRFFDSVRRRTERDVAALPPAAAAWRAPARGGEAGWSIGDIVSSTEPFYPRSLPTLLAPFLDG